MSDFLTDFDEEFKDAEAPEGSDFWLPPAGTHNAEVVSLQWVRPEAEGATPYLETTYRFLAPAIEGKESKSRNYVEGASLGFLKKHLKALGVWEEGVFLSEITDDVLAGYVDLPVEVFVKHKKGKQPEDGSKAKTFANIYVNKVIELNSRSPEQFNDTPYATEKEEIPFDIPSRDGDDLGL